MQATRRLCCAYGGGSSSSGGAYGVPKLLLPPPTFSDIASSALQGAWGHVTSQDSRDVYEELVEDNIIKDTVLWQATNGSTLTYSLFHNLQNPLFSKYKFNAKEFCLTAGPALENFHDTIAKLRNQLVDNIEKEKEEMNEKLENQSDEEIIKEAQGNIKQALLGVNLWQKQADEDDQSLAAILKRMTSEDCFDALYYTSKLDALGRAPGESMVYEDCSINEVALLGARVSIVPENDGEGSDNNSFEYEEFKATEELSGNAPIGAQMDVLFEVTTTFKVTRPAGPDDNDEEKKDGEEAKEEGVEEKVTITNLAVAIFEGWLHGGPMKDLRWRLAMLREAFEFPNSASSITRQ